MSAVSQVTTDIWFSSFLVLKGFAVANYEVVARGKARYFFNIDETSWRKMKLDFNNSEYAKFKQIQESLKDLSY